MSQENEIRIKLTPRTPTEILYQQTEDELRKTIAELQIQLQRERAVSNALAVALKGITTEYKGKRWIKVDCREMYLDSVEAALAQHAEMRKKFSVAKDDIR